MAIKAGELHPRSFATVSTLLEQRGDVLTLPITTMVRDGESVYYCVVSAGQIEHRPIKLGLRVEDDVEIVSGLKVIEAVFIVRVASLQPEQRVESIGECKVWFLHRQN